MLSKQERITKLLEVYLDNACKNGRQVLSYIPGIVAMELYERLAPHLQQPFDREAVEKYFTKKGYAPDEVIEILVGFEVLQKENVRFRCNIRSRHLHRHRRVTFAFEYVYANEYPPRGNKNQTDQEYDIGLFHFNPFFFSWGGIVPRRSQKFISRLLSLSAVSPQLLFGLPAPRLRLCAGRPHPDTPGRRILP